MVRVRPNPNLTNEHHANVGALMLGAHLMGHEHINIARLTNVLKLSTDQRQTTNLL